ncbi:MULTISPECIES: DMT family transporter [unclassified Rhodococcus (in: high G+C Gram-positive bacteria)]|uniref:DMT family transporter n=1 Tax=unclassified Rhodococcus (in: high G+C Gram-positive bacteria) TaxID=192944 RepID=UPI0027878472|nr:MULTISPECIES: DMT family transporter [unclassified Rhodococcus (in: high G+C Gram-positive bacteria)]MDQ1178719.1 drug/metabolite transporter (DMT)-like permease [Rhodococcus sp. SORGH_AS_0301]MDQ1199998.1 drug/metabolite transporter (DMT)-like permease [Rhodococcus sp. SORGH_AS_0303]
MNATVLAVLCAVGAAVCIAVGTVVRQRSAASIPDESVGRLGPITTLIREPLWWIGTVVGIGGYGLQAAALGLGSLLLVQPLLVLSLLFALPLGARFSGRTVSAKDWLWAAALTAAIAVLVVVGDPRPGVERAETRHWVVVLCVGIPFVLACVLGARSGSRSRRALLLGLAGGALFGVAAVLTKSVVHLAGRGPQPLLTSVEPYALVAVAVVAISLQQSAFQVGALQASLPATTVMEPMVASLLGFVVLGEYLDADREVTVVLVVALILVVVSAVALARSAGAAENVEPAHPAPNP